MSEGSVLYVEDDAYLASMVVPALEQRNLRVRWFVRGEDGIAALSRERFDVVVTDYRLPGCSGLEVVQAVVAHDPDLPVIMLSGSGDLTVAVTAIKLGAVDYLIKDLESAYLDILPAIVVRILETQRQLQDKKRVEAELEAERNWSRLAIDRISQGLSVFDADLRLQLCNKQVLAFCGYPEELGRRGTPLEAFLHFNAARGDYGEASSEEDIRRRLDRAREPTRFRFERRFGDTVVEVCREPLPQGGFVVTYTDITERWLAEQQIHFQAYHDALTGLPNRRQFHVMLENELLRAKRSGHGIAVLFIDLDGFKAVNDRYGHQAGDALLVEAAQRLKLYVRDSDVVARQGGDEFLVLLTRIEEAQAQNVAGKLIEALSAPFPVNGELAPISASIGIARFPEAGTSGDELVRAADRAMYQAKAAGKGRYFTALTL